jgi:hypothetical protein
VSGDLEEASGLIDQAERLRPGSVNLLRATLLARSGQPDKALACIDSAGKLNGDALLERGKLKDRLGNYHEAWVDFVAAKKLLASESGGLHYDASAVESFFASLKQTFDGSMMRNLPCAHTRLDVAAPLFITGAPRSGTTLLERILASHSKIAAGGELPFIGDLRELSEKLLPGPGFPRNLVALHAGDRHHIAALFRDYYFARRAERKIPGQDAAYVTDKMPFNEMYLPLIRLAFPQAPIIHMSRNRLDTAVSMLSNKLNHGFHCSYRIDDIMHHLDAVLELHRHYRQHLDTRELDIDYEILVADPEGQTRRMLDYVGLPFEDRCLRFHEVRRYVATPSYSQVSEQIFDRSVGRYRNYSHELKRYLGRA